MTAAEAAAQIAKLTAAGPSAYGASSGVFSLDQLTAMGRTGTLAQQWAAQAPTSGLIAGGGNATLTATNLKAGYYQIPGQQGAEYYDPASGQASSEFVAWANSLTPDQLDPFTGQPLHGFIAAQGGPEATNAANQPSAGALANFNAIIAGGKGADGTYQDSQDRVLGIGKYQQFVMGSNGQQVRIADAVGAAPAPTYTDVSTYAGKYKLVAPPGGNGEGQWQDANGVPVDYSLVAADIQAAAAAKDTHNQDAWTGLQQERIARGEDPMTGISAAETRSIYDTYQRIQDPAEKAAYIQAQDPGNLTAGLRKARTAARQGQVDWMTKNQLAPNVTYEMSSAYGDTSGTGGQVKTTFGDVTQTDAATGRSIMFGNVATAIEYVAPGNLGAFANAMHRVGGALYGGIMGYIGSLGSPMGAIMGAVVGSGAAGGLNLKNPGKTHWGASEKAGSIQDVALSLGEAMAFSAVGGQSMGHLGHAAIGAGFGTVNGFVSSGSGKGAALGGILGGVGGSMNGGGASQETWAQKMMGPSWNYGA